MLQAIGSSIAATGFDEYLQDFLQNLRYHDIFQKDDLRCLKTNVLY